MHPTRLARAAGLAVLLLLAVTALAPAPASAAARPGQRYDGMIDRDLRNHLVVSSDGTRLQRYVFRVGVSCSDGSGGFLAWDETGDPPIPIDPQGAFAFDSGPIRGRLGDGTPGVFRFRLDGRFDESGENVSGTITYLFEGRRLRCRRTTAHYTLHLDGTPNAPFTTGTMTNGIYFARGPGVELSLRTWVPSREILRVRVSYRARCRAGYRFTGIEVFRLVWLSGDRFRLRNSYRTPVRGGGTARIGSRLFGEFHRSPEGGYAVDGVWTLTATFRARDGRLQRCSQREQFSGTVDQGS
jgi:hypothetical protein